ncbi:hypothetical protein [Trinickia dinghuensis]|uniref:hypothetical protein n=1 Tax=Trinickia dinghuensis TaxID=2291023 RepID=UPI0011C0290D|nr:hypothetical protein [Trinickia dinghuensis]
MNPTKSPRHEAHAVADASPHATDAVSGVMLYVMHPKLLFRLVIGLGIVLGGMLILALHGPSFP